MTHRTLRILALALAALALASCKSKGVDMSRGGTELVYELKGEGGGEAALAEARKLALARLELLKIPAKVRIDGEKLKVQLPKSVGDEALERAKTTLGLRGVFEVRAVDDCVGLRAMGDLPEEAGARILQDNWQDHTGAKRGAFTVVSASAELARKVVEKAGFKPEEGVELMAERPLDPTQVRLYCVREAALKNADVAKVATPFDAYLPPEVSVTFSESGAKAFQELTRQALGRKIAYVVDGEVLETAAVLAPVSGGKASISQPWTGTKEQQQRHAEVHAAALRFGPMPGRLALVEEREIGGR